MLKLYQGTQWSFVTVDEAFICKSSSWRYCSSIKIVLVFFFQFDSFSMTRIWDMVVVYHNYFLCSQLRNTFRAGSSVFKLQVELWVAGGPRQEAGNCRSSAWQRTRGPLALPGDMGDTAGTDVPQTFLCLDCEGMKAQGLLCFGSLLAGTSLSCWFFLFNYCTMIKLF